MACPLPHSRRRLALAGCAAAAVLSLSSSAYAAEPAGLTASQWTQLLATLIPLALIQTAGFFHLQGRQAGKISSLEEEMKAMQQERKADRADAAKARADDRLAHEQARREDLVGIKETLAAMGERLQQMAETSATFDKGAGLLDFRMGLIEKNTDATLALRDAVNRLSTMQETQHTQVTQELSRMDRRLTNALAQVQRVGAQAMQQLSEAQT
jgi:hypothetical protein